MGEAVRRRLIIRIAHARENVPSSLAFIAANVDREIRGVRWVRMTCRHVHGTRLRRTALNDGLAVLINAGVEERCSHRIARLAFDVVENVAQFPQRVVLRGRSGRWVDGDELLAGRRLLVAAAPTLPG
jgi:hypothetical protein